MKDFPKILKIKKFPKVQQVKNMQSLVRNILQMPFNAFSTLDPALNQGRVTGPYPQSTQNKKQKAFPLLA